MMTPPPGEPFLRGMPAAGPPTLPQDFLDPRDGEAALTGQSPNDLASRPVRMLFAQRRDTAAREGAPIERPADLAVDGAAVGCGGTAGAYEFFRAGDCERVLGTGSGDELGDAVVGMLCPQSLDERLRLVA